MCTGRVFSFLDNETLFADSDHISSGMDDDITKQQPATNVTKHHNSDDIGDDFVELSSVDFAYPSRPSKPVLKNFSVTIPRSGFVCFRGPSGAGKSTVLALVSALYTPVNGRVMVDGMDIAALSAEQRRACIARTFAVVEQSLEPLLSGTIAYNIKYGKVSKLRMQREASVSTDLVFLLYLRLLFVPIQENETDEEGVAAAKAASAHDFIIQQPAGYEMQVCALYRRR